MKTFKQKIKEAMQPETLNGVTYQAKMLVTGRTTKSGVFLRIKIGF